MKELWPLEENKYIFLFYGETVPINEVVVTAIILDSCLGQIQKF